MKYDSAGRHVETGCRAIPVVTKKCILMLPEDIARKVQFSVDDKRGLISWESVQRIARLVREQSLTCLGVMEKLRRSEYIRMADAQRERIYV